MTEELKTFFKNRGYQPYYIWPNLLLKWITFGYYDEPETYLPKIKKEKTYRLYKG